MMTKVFAIYDCKVEAFMAPFMMQAVGQAIRAVQDAASDPKTQFHKHPADFTLFHIANFNEATGEYENLQAKANLGTILEIQGARGAPNIAEVV